MENVYIIAAGGTGGHFYPGYALGKKLIERGHDVVFIVKKGGRSSEILAASDMNYQEISFTQMPRGKNIFKWTSFGFKLAKCLWQMRKLIKAYKPKVCIGMGGYISFPLIFAAHYMGVKTVVHDSNSKIGFANKISAKFVDLFLLGLPTQDKVKNSLLVGTPVREEFNIKESEEERNYWQFATDFSINILIFGGSQGARNLNFSAAKTALNLLQKTNRLHFLHITGNRDFDEIKTLYGEVKGVEVIAYADDIYSLMKAAQLIVARSGASSMAEIISLQKPSLLVPYPFAADNHQYYNAKILADKGCAIIVKEDENLSANLEETIKTLLTSPQAIKNMSNSFANSHLPDPLEAATLSAKAIENLTAPRSGNSKHKSDIL
ncbi:MAG: UDP-N-acetylglucosamine--N-acetylmuramyl-(pentapeptide) pyrophosphoryl-undecaprenol N-acetylglucosamine transferase [Elusimicrobiota bacterium]|jgi:UDP-N-acetylglucosamine--N-acetylmuramyl-(pentapeptide) pyrophosphoryl-undecaprenol N-acetylglucosamine transferase|nr:UDP-N-acetylglucosamine--N-acetylmuramyl-(pentapeptide) pyrophosphoryl-undecaprenol N-acetylglucosamine transferase [Elusimicrobiota bacterium]